MIRRITGGSPASKADLKTKDVIIAVNGTQVTSPDDLAADVRKLTPGAKATVLIERGGSQKTVSVTLGTRPTLAG